MSKVKLTQKQARMFENYKYAVKTLLQKRVCDNCPTNIDSLPIDDVVKAIVYGYEVEREFKVGDWVVRTKELDHQNFHEGKIFKINSVIKSKLTKELMVVDADDNSEHIFNNIRHATPEEIAEEKRRRWWSARNREVWELKVGDVLKHKSDGECFSITKNSVEVLKQHPKNKLDRFYKVICLAENREDAEE